MREVYYPTWYMPLKTPMKRPGTGLPKILKPVAPMTGATRKYKRTGLNSTSPTGYFTVFDSFQKTILTIPP